MSPKRLLEAMVALLAGMAVAALLRGPVASWWAGRHADRAQLAAGSARDSGDDIDAGDTEDDEATATPQPQEGRCVLRGVVRLGGRGVGAVEVTLGAGPTVPGRAASTDDNGNYEVAALPPGRYAVRAVGVADSAYRDAVVVAGTAEHPTVLDLNLVAAPPLVGRILDESGKAVAGADVTLVESGDAPLPRRATSDEQGGFRFAAVLPGLYRIAARMAGYVASASAVRAPLPSGVTLKIGRGGTILGDVVDDSGRAVEGARLTLWREDGSLAWPHRAAATSVASPVVEQVGELGVIKGSIPYPPLDPPTVNDVRAPSVLARATGASAAGMAWSAHVAASPGNPGSISLSDAKGKFRLTDVPVGKLVVSAAHPSWIEARSATVDLAPGGEARVHLTLRHATMLKGRVVDALGAAVAGAEVWLDGTLGAVSDARGRFEIRRAASASGGELEVRARGHLPTRKAVDGAAGSIELAVGEAAARLTGVALDTRGLPVAGARVAVEGSGGVRRVAVTDRSGEFTVTDVPAGPLTVHVSHGDHQRATVQTVEAGDDVRVTLAPGGAVEGQVAAQRGGVIPGAKVTVDDAAGERKLAHVDGQGRFRVSGCAPGVAVVSAEAPGFVPAHVEVELPVAEASGEVVLRDLSFALLEAGAVAGMVRDNRGLPVVGATVEVPGQRARTDNAGRFRLSNVPIGPTPVWAHGSSGSAADNVTVEKSREATVDLRLQ